MIELYNSFVNLSGTILYPFEIVLEQLPFATLVVICLGVAFISLYSALTDKYVWKYYKVTIVRRVARLLIVIFLVAGTYNLLILFLLCYYILLMILEIKETADKRFSREIE